MFAKKWMALTPALVALALIGCKKDQSHSAPGAMPPADDWQAPSPMTPGAAAPTAPHGGAAGADPHAGMNMGGGADPHAGMNMGGGADPHAGMDMGGGDPHAGMDMGGAGMAMGDPAMAAIQPPDPNRKIDESKFLAGSIVANDVTSPLIKAGAIVFISVRPIDPNTGELIGGVVAVDRIDVTALPVSFRLTERNAMSAGTQFSGSVLITARVDGDGEARSKSPGDVEGSLRAKVPADGLTLTLDSVLR